MLAVRLYLFVVGATPYGIIAVFVHVELDSLNVQTTRPISGGMSKNGCEPNVLQVLEIGRRELRTQYVAVLQQCPLTLSFVSGDIIYGCRTCRS